MAKSEIYTTSRFEGIAVDDLDGDNKPDVVMGNYDSSKISIYSKGTIKYPKGGYLLKPLLVSIPIQNGRIREQSEEVLGRFYFDIGCSALLNG